MPKRKKSPASSRLGAALFLIVAAVLVFGAVETWKLWSSDSGRILLAARFGIGDPARVTQILAREIRRGLTAAGVPADSIEERAAEPGVRWRVGLPPEASLLQTNYAVTRCVEEAGGVVLSGLERGGPNGEPTVKLRIGLPGHALHDVTLVRVPHSAAERAAEPVRMALLLYGFGEDPDKAVDIFALPVPFAVAVVPGASASARLFRVAHQRAREVVMHLPLEPVNYPQVNPGPGTILVTMNEPRITGLLRRDFDQAGSVVAVANHMGSLATQDMSVMTSVFRELNRRSVPFFQVQPAAGSVCKSLASNLGVVYDEPDVVVDAEARTTAAALDARWNAVLKQARARGQLIVMIRATPKLIDWLPRAASAKRLAGVNLVPLSALLRRPMTL